MTNFLAWDGKRHIEFDYNHFKHLCFRFLGEPKYWKDRINIKERLIEVLSHERPVTVIPNGIRKEVYCGDMRNMKLRLRYNGTLVYKCYKCGKVVDLK